MNGFDHRQLSVAVTERDHRLGSLDAPVTLVEYGDYQSPGCAAAQPIAEALKKHFGRQLCFVFRHFPLTEIHPHAWLAAEAAEAAGAHGRFWQMHDLLLANQTALGNGHLVEYAVRADVEFNRFLRDLTGHSFASKVQSDLDGGVGSGVTQPPTFFINGRRYDKAANRFELLAAIENAASKIAAIGGDGYLTNDSNHKN